MNAGNKAALLYLLFATGWYVVFSHSNSEFGFYGGILFFVAHYPGLILAKLFYIHEINEPWWQMHLIAAFMIAINVLIIYITFLLFTFLRTRRL